MRRRARRNAHAPRAAASPAARARREDDSGRGAWGWLTRDGALAGTGFLPKETAEHHRRFVVKLVKEAIEVAGIKPQELDCVCYTKGPGMGGIACMPFAPPRIWRRCASARPSRRLPPPSFLGPGPCSPDLSRSPAPPRLSGSAPALFSS